MKATSRHMGAIVLIIAAAAIATLWFLIGARKDSGQLYLTDLAGERSALADIRIEGLIKDGYHSTAFHVDAGAVRSKTAIHADPGTVQWEQNSPGKAKIMGDRQYEVHGTNPYTIISKDKNVLEQQKGIEQAEVYSSLSLVHSESDTGRKYTNPLEYGLAKVGEQIYFTVPTVLDFTGTNGIYALKFQKGLQEEKQYAEPVATFSLEDNDPAKGAGLQVLGLEAAGDKLALLATRNGEWLVRGYDSRTGSFLGEAVFPDLAAGWDGAGNRTQADSGSPSVSVSYQYYKAYPSHDNGTVTFCFSAYDNNSGQPGNVWVTVGLSDEAVQLLHVLRTDFTDGDEDTLYGISQAFFQNARLYIVKTFREPEGENSPAFELLRNKRILIYIYENSSLLYKGELVTDINDDSLHALNLPPASTVSYDLTNHRHLHQVQIMPRSSEGGPADD